jgi:hypothetical protein
MGAPNQAEIEAIVRMEADRAARAEKPASTGMYSSPAAQVYYDLALKSDTAHERTFAEECVQPGDFCYKMVAASSAPGSSYQSRRMVIACPVCNRVQILPAKVDYRYGGGWQTRVKFFINRIAEAVIHRVPFAIRGTATTPEVACQFNKLHVFQIDNNHIRSPLKLHAEPVPEGHQEAERASVV